MAKREKFQKFIKIFVSHYQKANLSDGAVVIAFYLLLSLFPILIILGSLLRLFNLNSTTLLQNVHVFLPASVRTTLQPILVSTLKGSNGGQLSFGIVTALWSASRVVAAFQRTVNAAYGVTEKPNAILNRLTSFLWLTLGLLLFVLAMIFFTLGHFIVDFLFNNFSIDKHLLLTLQSLSWAISLVIVFLLFNLLFYFVPSVKTKFRYTWQGSLLVTFGVILLSQFFSLYIKYFMHSVSAYQTLSAFVILMFWLYFLGMLILFSAVFNASLQEYVDGPIRADGVDQIITRKIKQHHSK